MPDQELRQACQAQIKANQDRANRGQNLLIISNFGFSLRDFYSAAQINFDSRGKQFTDTDRISSAAEVPFTETLFQKRNGVVQIASALPTISDSIIEQWLK